MYYSTTQEFEKLCKQGNLVPVYREILADVETPVSAFIKMDNGKHVCLLESVEKGERWGRYSFLSVDPFMIFQTKGKVAYLLKSEGKNETYQIEGDPLSVLKKIMKRFKVVNLPHLPIFFGGAVGYVGYDVIKFWEKIPHLRKKDLNFPDCFFIFTGDVIIFDHLDHKMKIVSYAFLNGKSPKEAYRQAKERIEKIISRLSHNLDNPRNKILRKVSNREIKSNFTPEEFMGSVIKAKEYIKKGDIFQVVLSQRLEREISVSPFDIYRVLRSLNPSPYMYYLRCGDFSLVGSSPEILVRKEGEDVTLRPIAGTRPRGRNQEEDQKLAGDLVKDEKERAEHIMLVDLGRNDLGRVCDYGTVKVEELFSVERYSHVMHLASEVRGNLKKGVDRFDLLRACFPAGTVSGAPKVRAMQIIEDLEPSHRGPYAGALGYFSFSGNMDTCIIIRTMIVHQNIAYVQAGAGIVADSDPENEFKETLNKAKALVKAIDLAEGGREWL